MKRFFKIVFALTALCLAAALFASCGETTNAPAETQGENGGTKETDAPETEGTDAPETEAKADADYSSPDLVVEDFEGMEAFLDAWGENTWDGKVIQIKGISERRISNCTISIKNEDGYGRGCSYEIIDGNFPDDYPAEDAEVTVTGVLYFDPDTWARVLQVPADQIIR